MERDDFDGGPHTHGLGGIGLVLVCAGLAVGGVVSLVGSFRLEGPQLLWLFVPVPLAAIGSYYAYSCDDTRRTWGTANRFDVGGAKPRMMEMARKSHARAGTVQAAALFLSLPGAAGTFEVLFL